ncbi:MAG: creatininase family protein [Oligoflexia bacterium]|nr:creatininase family protein [Oligoflexia bacterium]
MKNLIAVVIVSIGAVAMAANKGKVLEDLTWKEAEKALTPQTIVVIPLGAAAKEHGPHLKLKNDFLMAEYLKKRVIKKANVVIAPTLNYGFYPAFLDYPGSTHLRLETARDMVVDICKSLAQHGPKKFYVINTGVSTLKSLAPAAELLAKEGITLHYTNILKAMEPVEKAVLKQEGGTHADEGETSMMLVMAPESVDMKKAQKDYHPGDGPLSRTKKEGTTFSASGIWGDATLASKAKVLVEALVKSIMTDIQNLENLR